MLLQIGLSMLLVTGFSICLTALTSPAPRLNLDEFLTGLYLWPLMSWDVLRHSMNKAWQRATVLVLYTGLAYLLWLVWGWPLTLFLPAFVLGLPIVWMIGAVATIVCYTILGRMSVKKSHSSPSGP